MSRLRGIRMAKGQSYETIEHEARAAIEHLLPDHPVDAALPGLEFWDRLPELSVPLNGEQVPLYGGVVDRLPPGELARTRWVEEEHCLAIELTTETYWALEADEHRARFSLWHEVGHAWLHCAELLSRSWIPHHRAALARGAATHPIYMDSEWQADAFAAAALMPIDCLRALNAGGRLNSMMLAFDRRVSEQAARYRIENARNRFRL